MFENYLNQEALKDFYPIPKEEELLKIQNGKSDNYLTGKKLSFIFERLYIESDYLMQMSFSAFEEAGYELKDVSNEFKNKENVYRLVFSDNSSLDFWNLV